MQYTYAGNIDKEFGDLYEKYSGSVTQEMVDNINAEYDEMLQEWYRLCDKRNEMEANSADENDLNRMNFKIQKIAHEISMPGFFVEKAEDCWAYTCETCISVEIINRNGYNLLLSGDRHTTSKNSLYVLLALIAAFGGIMASEKQSNMTSTLKSLKRGRFCLTANKVILVLAVCIVLSLSVNMAQLCKTVESIIIPDSVTSIGKYAFSGCSNLTSIVLPDSITYIGEDAFRGCANLASISVVDARSIQDYEKKVLPINSLQILFITLLLIMRNR